MYKIKSALCVFLMFNSMHVPALHRFMSTMPRLMTFSSASKALSKSHVPVNRIIPIRMGQAPKLTTQPQLLLKPTQFQKHAHIKHQKFNWNRARNISCLVGTGAALLALHNTRAKAEGNEQEKEKQALEPYRNPYEEQRKKYYEELLAKPWGAVSKKYIDALEAEEKELMKEFFELTRISEEQFGVFRTEIFGEVRNWKVEKVLKEYSDDKELVLDIFRERAAILLSKYDMKDVKQLISLEVQTMAASNIDNILIFGRYCLKDKLWEKSDSGYWRIDNAYADSIILHEMQHLMHQDIFNKLLLRSLIEKKDLKNELYIRYCKFTEKRADVLASLNDIDIAKNAYKIFNASTMMIILKNETFLPLMIILAKMCCVPLQSILVKNSTTHPDPISTICYLTQIHQEMLDSIEKNKQKTT